MSVYREEVDIPLCVDLDGTLTLTDTLHETILSFCSAKLYRVFLLFWSLFRGKAYFKHFLASKISIDPALIPYDEKFIDWLTTQKNSGRRLVLVTASNQQVAGSIASHLNIFDEVIASDERVNLAGVKKAECLVKKFGDRGFDYAGNSSVDIKVWEKSRKAIVVNASRSVKKKALSAFNVEQNFDGVPSGVKVWIKAARVHQWLKNLLLFVAVFASHEIQNPSNFYNLALAFFSFSLCASSVYFLNDLLDLKNDRLHPRKRYRPLASGHLPIWKGVAAVPVLLGLGFFISLEISADFFIWLLSYYIVTCMYSFFLKRVVILDVIVLALLYTMRVAAGAAAIGLIQSVWLLAFSIFLFLSLAFLKRFTELQEQLKSDEKKVSGRGYLTSDITFVAFLGLTAGSSAALVLAIYLNNSAISALYYNPLIALGCVPVILYWISWVWLKAHRGEMHDDPVLFAIKDRFSQIAGVIFLLILLLASMEM